MLQAYMIYSRFLGPSEGAGLVFAHSVREARKVGWQRTSGDFTDDFLDFAAKRIRNSPWILGEANVNKLASDEPHVIDNPRSCSICEHWGHSPIGNDELCEDCRPAPAPVESRPCPNCGSNRRTSLAGNIVCLGCGMYYAPAREEEE